MICLERECRRSKLGATPILVHSSHMNSEIERNDDTAMLGIAIWVMFVGLMCLVILALPAYLQTIEIQFLDNEFLSSLCGFAGWGPSGS